MLVYISNYFTLHTLTVTQPPHKPQKTFPVYNLNQINFSLSTLMQLIEEFIDHDSVLEIKQSVRAYFLLPFNHSDMFLFMYVWGCKKTENKSLIICFETKERSDHELCSQTKRIVSRKRTKRLHSACEMQKIDLRRGGDRMLCVIELVLCER